jgi:hypothetical protein
MRMRRSLRSGHRPTIHHITAVVFLTTALVGTAPGAAIAGSAEPAADPSVITDWNATAVATIVVDAGKANAEAPMWYSFVHLAVYNAVVGITERYEQYKWDEEGDEDASPEAAAAAAAHRILMEYFPASQSRLDAALADSLSTIPAGEAREEGIEYGVEAAEHIIDLRVDDGRFAPVTYDEPPGPGVWRPTPPTMTPFFDPWLGQVRPLTMLSSDQFLSRPPLRLGSDRYTEEFAEVKSLGAKTGSARTPEQTQTALFFSDVGIVPYQAALRDLATRHAMDISDSARMFAAVDASIADALIASWNAKLEYAFWRPITAIHLADTDGNPATAPDTSWEPLVTTPPYPEHPSGLTPATGAMLRALRLILDSYRIDLFITSTAAGLPGPPVTRHYEFAPKLAHDVVEARIWSGVHFRLADKAGMNMGRKVAVWALDHFFEEED